MIGIESLLAVKVCLIAVSHRYKNASKKYRDTRDLFYWNNYKIYNFWQ